MIHLDPSICMHQDRLCDAVTRGFVILTSIFCAFEKKDICSYYWLHQPDIDNGFIDVLLYTTHQYTSTIHYVKLQSNNQSSLLFPDHDLVGQHTLFAEQTAVSSTTHPCPYIAYLGPIHPSSSNSSGSVSSDGSSFNNHWNNNQSTLSEIPPTSYAFPTMDVHYQSWDHHHSFAFSMTSSRIGCSDQPPILSMTQRVAMANSDISILGSLGHPFCCGPWASNQLPLTLVTSPEALQSSAVGPGTLHAFLQFCSGGLKPTWVCVLDMAFGFVLGTPGVRGNAEFDSGVAPIENESNTGEFAASVQGFKWIEIHKGKKVLGEASGSHLVSQLSEAYEVGGDVVSPFEDEADSVGSIRSDGGRGLIVHVPPHLRRLTELCILPSKNSNAVIWNCSKMDIQEVKGRFLKDSENFDFWLKKRVPSISCASRTPILVDQSSKKNKGRRKKGAHGGRKICCA
ncbi:hypothetical protein LguiB_006178 [Lonicera macranthoides]